MREPKRGYVYIMTNGVSGTLYIGVTAHLCQRIDQHGRGVGSDFRRRYGCTRLVHVEVFDLITDAIARERATKAWRRNWKLNLVSRANPDCCDLWNEYVRPQETARPLSPQRRLGGQCHLASRADLADRARRATIRIRSGHR